MFHILFSIIFCGCFYIFHMLNSHDRSCVISQHTFHTISHTFHSFTYLFHSIWWCEKEDIISHGFHMVISHYFSQMCEIVREKPNENFTCTSHAFHIIFSSSDPITRQYVFVGACLQKITWWSACHNEIRDLQAKLLDMVCYDGCASWTGITTYYRRRARQRDSPSPWCMPWRPL